MSNHLRTFSIIMLTISANAQAAGWQLQPPEGSRGALLTFDADKPVSYRFECAPSELIVTETGVTKLLDLKTGKSIGDDAQAAMPEGAAVMALFAGKGQPQFMPAEALKNPGGGWDLTIRIPKTDKQIKVIGKSELMSLFTTGYTMAVAMNPGSRAQWNTFMQHCQSAT